MSQLGIYAFILSSLVFIVLAGLLGTLLFILVRLMIKLIRSGIDDEKIIKEIDSHKKENPKHAFIKEWGVSGIFFILVIILFIFSLYINLTGNKTPQKGPVLKVVRSSSMSCKNEQNKYLLENNLNNQFSTFDIIITSKLPDEFDLELYDVVLYEYNDKLIIHRIIKIEEPNEKHQNCRYFQLQGDAVDTPDKFPVLYEQMRGIYTGKKISNIGSLTVFMQSPAGYLCILLVIFSVIAVPLIEKKLEKEKMLRYDLYLNKSTNDMTYEETVKEELDVCIKEEKVLNVKMTDIDEYHEQTRIIPKKFLDSLMFASNEVKAYYNEIKNYLLMYGCQSLYLNSSENFNNTTIITKLFYEKRTLKAYIAFDPIKIPKNKYKFKDVSMNKEFLYVPTMVKINSIENILSFKGIIDLLMEEKGYTKNVDYVNVDFVSSLIPSGRAVMAEAGLTTNYLKESIDAASLPAGPINIEKVNAFLPKLISTDIDYVVCYTDTINDNFNENEIACIDTLIEKGIIESGNFLKIEARGSITHPFTVYAHEFSNEALTMLLGTNCTVIRITNVSDPIIDIEEDIDDEESFEDDIEIDNIDISNIDDIEDQNIDELTITEDILNDSNLNEENIIIEEINENIAIEDPLFDPIEDLLDFDNIAFDDMEEGEKSLFDDELDIK